MRVLVGGQRRRIEILTTTMLHHYRRRSPSALGDYAANAGQITDRHGHQDGHDGAVYVLFGNYDQTKAGPIFTASRIAVRNVIDGLSNTLAIGERYIPPVPAGTPQRWNTTPKETRRSFPATNRGPFSLGRRTGWRADRANPAGREANSAVRISAWFDFLFLDGHVTALDDTIDPSELLALCTMAGGETLKRISAGRVFLQWR